MRGAETSYFGVSGGRLLRRLGEPLYGRRCGRVRTLNDLARAGLPVPDGVVLTQEAHEVVLETMEKVAVRERVPTWPALLQREVRPLSTGWSTVERALIETPWVGNDLRGQKVALYDVEPFDEESPEQPASPWKQRRHWGLYLGSCGDLKAAGGTSSRQR
jgi:hypothetical protein